jgi:hypothetical protein
MTPQQQLINKFGVDLRSILFLNQILEYYYDGILSNRVVPENIKAELRVRKNGIKRLHNVLKSDASDDIWNRIKSDYTADRIHDLSLLINEVQDVVNIEAITNLARITKESQVNILLTTKQ